MSEHPEQTVGVSDPALQAWLTQLQETSFERAGPTLRAAYPRHRRMTAAQLAGYLTGRTYALASSTRPDGRPHAAPTLFTIYAEAFWLPTLGAAVRVRNVQANPWLALSIIEGEHDTHAAVLIEGPAEVLSTAPPAVWTITQRRNNGASLDWSAAWLCLTPHWLFSFAERGWQNLPANRPTP